jgi:hypothetical protein
LELSYSSLLNDPFLSFKNFSLSSITSIQIGDSFWIADNSKFKNLLEEAANMEINTLVDVTVIDKQHMIWADPPIHCVRLALSVD